jgi:hypothetical protein
VAKRWESHTPKGADLPRKVTADIGSGDVHVDGLSGGYRLQTTTETNPKIPNLRPDIQPTFEQPVPPKAVDIMPTPRWPLSQRIQMAQNVNMISAAKRIRLPTDKFALPDQRKYPIDTASRTRNAAARLEQNKARLSPADYSKAKAAIGRAAKKFGIHSEYNEPAKATDSRATDHLVPHMRVEATIPHGGSLHVRHLDDSGAGTFVDAIALTDLNADDGPVWNQVACVGAFRGHPAGPFELNDTVFTEIVRNWEAGGRKPIPVDYEHASEADATAGSIPTHGAPAQGWITDLVNRGVAGLFGKFEWLAQARAQIRGGQYKFLSPAIRFESRDKVTGRPIGARLTSAALTNQPFLDRLAPVQAKAVARDLIAATDKGTPVTTTVAKTEGRTVSMQSTMEKDDGAVPHYVIPSSDYMPKIKAAMGMHPLANYEEMKDSLDRLRDMVARCGGNLTQLVDGVSLGSFIKPLRDLTMGANAGASTKVEQILYAVEEMIDAAQAEHIAIGHPAAANMAGYGDDPTAMATAIESDKGKQTAALAGYGDDPTATMADTSGAEDMATVAEKDAEITWQTLLLSDKGSEIKRLTAEKAALATENATLVAFKTQREEQDLESDVAFVMSAHADKISTLPGDDVAKKAFLTDARKKLGDGFWTIYPKDADPATQYLLRTQTPVAPAAKTDQLPEIDAITSRNEDLRATIVRLRDEKKLSYIDAAQEAMRLHALVRKMTG